MRQEEFDKMLEECFSKMKQILICKGADYSGKDDRFGNFRLSEKMGVPVWKGILIRLSDKVSRVLNLASGAAAQVKDESVEDTLLDLANYALLCLIAYRENKYRNVKLDKVSAATAVNENYFTNLIKAQNLEMLKKELDLKKEQERNKEGRSIFGDFNPNAPFWKARF